MYNKEKPYNELGKLPPNFNFDDVDILKLVNKANIALSALNGAAHLLPNRFILCEPLTVKEAVASSGIENINTTVSDVFQAELLPKEDVTKAQKETLHYKDALMRGLVIVKEKQFLNTNHYIQLQSILEPDKSGVRKIGDTKTPVRIENSTTGEVIYTPPDDHGIILGLLKNYEDYFNRVDGVDDVDALIKMALLHYQFEAIHPFRDGNGRLGRILMVLYLVLANRIDLPILFISGYINKTREQYYKILKEVTEKGDWKNLVMYMLTAVIEQSNSTRKIVIEIKKLIIDYNRRSEEESLPNSTQFVDYLFSKPVYTYNDLAKKMKVHRNTAMKYLMALHNVGILKKQKVKKEVIYFNPEFLRLLS